MKEAPFESPYVKLKEFMILIDVSYQKAIEISRKKELIDSGISVDLSPEKKKRNIRIHWPKFMEYHESRLNDIKYIQKHNKTDLRIITGKAI